MAWQAVCKCMCGGIGTCTDAFTSHLRYTACWTWLRSRPLPQDHDDDGEAAAGGRLLHLLQVTGARNVCVVVSRWWVPGTGERSSALATGSLRGMRHQYKPTSCRACLLCRYGGILLGPARFTHINNAARVLLDACGYIADKAAGGKGRKR